MTDAEWNALMLAAGDLDSISCEWGYTVRQRQQVIVKLYREHPECVIRTKVDRHGHLWVWYRNPEWHGRAVMVSMPDCEGYRTSRAHERSVLEQDLRQRLLAVERYWCEHNGDLATRRRALLPVYQSSPLVANAMIDERGSLVVSYRELNEPVHIQLVHCDELDSIMGTEPEQR